ncbi:MAG: nucleotide sugar dehydrogenase [Chloroflexi bacterium]|nr:nucleotide sugar dehydrogenase [Chloroflexota bacterium]MBU1748427.1 nucleotide sugar dehydrogenase [Chloroflexota bacterium]MBU1878349.1 nucleotide sugar dehydrogenase [Chloroflexota bacterium]
MANILCIGAGHVGGPTMAVIAKNCPQHRVVVVDVDAARVAAWQSDRLPIYEPGLDEIIHCTRGKNLFFSTEINRHIAEADIIFVSVNTPTKSFGQGAGKAADLQYWELAARQILENATTPKIVVEKSTVPVRTAEAMECILNSESGNGLHFDVVSNPEFMAEGTAIRDLEEPDRVLIGGPETPSGQKAVQAIVDIHARWVPRERIITTNLWSGELSKLAANAFLAQRISSINAISALCERTEADVNEVAHAVGLDGRIGPRFLRASVGFGGSCFKKDILNLVYLCEYYGLYEVATYWEQVVAMNEYQQQRFVSNMVYAMFNTVAHKRIALFGAAFKANTSDTRESPALVVCRALLDERADVVITDPYALENARFDLGEMAGQVTFEPDPYAAARDAHAIAILTEWSHFVDLDYAAIYESMVKPAFIFDGRNLLDRARLHEIGFNVYAIGKPPLTHFATTAPIR